MSPWRVAAIGQCCLDRLGVIDSFPEPNDKTEIALWDEQIGGPAATALVTLSRLRVSTSLFSIVGDDPEAEKLRSFLDREGVEQSGVVTRAGTRSQRAFIAVERGTGRRTIFWQRAEGAPLTAEELPGSFPEGYDFLHLDGLMERISIQAALLAREKGIPVMLDAGRIRSRTVELARHCNYLIGSEVFATQMGWGEPGFRDRVMNLGVDAAVFTFGERGCHTFTRDDAFETPAFRVCVLDTTGAGDVFHGAFLYGLLQKWDLRRSVRFASAAAAIKCTRWGGSGGAPTLQEVHQFLQSVS